MPLTDVLATYIQTLLAKKVQVRASADAELARLDESLVNARAALTLAQATPDLDRLLKFLNDQGIGR